MKRTKAIVLALLLISVLFTSCDHESIKTKGEVTQTEFSFTNYNTLKVSDDFNVFVNFSNTEEKIVVEANSDIQDLIVIRKDGNTLVAKLRNNVSIRGNATMNIYITTANISGFLGSGDVNITLEDELVTETALINLSGDSNFKGKLNISRLNLDIDGDSDVDIYGSADSVKANLSRDSDLRDYDLSIKELDINLSGDSDAFLSVSESISIRATGDSSLNYKGDATILEQNLSGDSKITKS